MNLQKYPYRLDFSYDKMECLFIIWTAQYDKSLSCAAFAAHVTCLAHLGAIATNIILTHTMISVTGG